MGARKHSFGEGREVSWRFSSFWNNHLCITVRETTPARDHQSDALIQLENTDTLSSILPSESLPPSFNFVIWGNEKLLPLTPLEHQRCKSTTFLESLECCWLPFPQPALLDSFLQPVECHTFQAPQTKHLWLFVYIMEEGHQRLTA